MLSPVFELTMPSLVFSPGGSDSIPRALKECFSNFFNHFELNLFGKMKDSADPKNMLYP